MYAPFGFFVLMFCILAGCSGQDVAPGKVAPTESVQPPTEGDTDQVTSVPALWNDSIAAEIVKDIDPTDPVSTYVIRWKDGILQGQVSLSQGPDAEPETLDISDDDPSSVVIEQMHRISPKFPQIQVTGYLVVRMYESGEDSESTQWRQVKLSGRTTWSYKTENTGFTEERDIVRHEGSLFWPGSTSTSMANSEIDEATDLRFTTWEMDLKSKPNVLPDMNLFLDLKLRAIEVTAPAKGEAANLSAESTEMIVEKPVPAK